MPPHKRGYRYENTAECRMGVTRLGRDFQADFFRNLPGLLPLMDLFESAPGVFFYAKDVSSRFVRMNRANLAVYNLTDEEAVLGRTDRDFHPPSLAEAYIAEDRQVMQQGRPLPNQTWLVPILGGPLQWFVSSKTPLLGPGEQCVGVAGAMYPIATPEDQLGRFQRLAPAIRLIEQTYREPLEIDSLCTACGLSATHFHRLFLKLLRMSPTDYQLALRMQEARRLLSMTDHSLTAVAMETGFYDQSHFTKRFRRSTGMTPTAYRRTFGRQAPAG